MRNTTRRTTKEGYDSIEYLYECEKCDNTIWSHSKKLFTVCSTCFVNQVKSRMRMAL